jgi:hypothetical protein
MFCILNISGKTMTSCNEHVNFEEILLCSSGMKDRPSHLQPALYLL